MAMGGHHTKGNGGHRGKPYGLMLLLAFGAALLGVMTLHKFRERRIFNQLLKDKDRELYSLNFLLQKEKDRSKEMKDKMDEMKTKIYTLRSKKMELDNGLLEMQSTINSLKVEHGTMETALEEKQEEVKILREKEIDSGKREESQQSSLVEILKQKDSEIEDLKRRLETQVKVLSVSSNDHSNKELNATNKNLIKSQDDAVVVLREKLNTTNEATIVEDAIKIEKINGDENVVSEAKDDDGKGAVDAERKVEGAKLEEVGKSESSENSEGGGGGGSMARVRKKGKKLRPLTRKRRSRSSATLKHRSSDEETSKDGSEEQIVIKPVVYESDLGNGKEGEGGNGSSNGDAVSRVEEVSELKFADSDGQSADSQELQTERKSRNGESVDSRELQTEEKITNGETADAQEVQSELQTEKNPNSIEGEDKEEEIDEAVF